MANADVISIGSLLVIVLSTLLLVMLERCIPYHKQRLLRNGFYTDLFMYGIIQSYILSLLISFVVSIVDEHTNLERWHTLRAMPIVAQSLMFLVVHDFYIYWFHRWQHSNTYLWRLHEAHHSTVDVDWLSGARSHSLEIVINQSIEFLPIVLFASPEIAVIKGTIDAVWGMYIHSNIDVRSGWLQYILNGPEMHRWHHALDANAHNKNFSTKLAIWDWLFGTAYYPRTIKPSAYGIDIDYPRNYFRQHGYAFRRSEQK